MPEIVLTRRAARDLRQLDRSVQRRILDKVRTYSADPLRNASKLTDPSIGTFRYRVGDYRVIFDLDGDTIVILRIGDRKNIYS